MSDNALLVTPTQGSVSTVTVDQSFISEGHIGEMFSTTKQYCFAIIVTLSEEDAYHGKLLRVITWMTIDGAVALRISVTGLLPQLQDLLLNLSHQCFYPLLLIFLFLLNGSNNCFVTLLHGIYEGRKNFLTLSHLSEVGALIGHDCLMTQIYILILSKLLCYVVFSAHLLKPKRIF